MKSAKVGGSRCHAHERERERDRERDDLDTHATDADGGDIAYYPTSWGEETPRRACCWGGASHLLFSSPLQYDFFLICMQRYNNHKIGIGGFSEVAELSTIISNPSW